MDGFTVWPGGSAPPQTTKAITGSSSLEATLAPGAVLFLSEETAGVGSVHATAELRNDGTAPVTITSCAGIYDTAWASVSTCTTVTLAPGVVTPVAAEYAIPSGTTSRAANWYLDTISGAATIAVDDAYLGYAPN